jgi:hypothetical protein
MAITFGTGSLALVTLGIATTLLISERPGHGPTGPNRDLTAPEVPSGLAARLLEGDGTEVKLSWSANRRDPDLTGYIVYRSDQPEGGFRSITVEPVLTNAFVDHDAPEGRECFYRVSARDASRNESALSALISVRTLTGAGASEGHETVLNAGI